jgi:hypothetical protein
VPPFFLEPDFVAARGNRVITGVLPLTLPLTRAPTLSPQRGEELPAYSLHRWWGEAVTG